MNEFSEVKKNESRLRENEREGERLKKIKMKNGRK